MSERGDWRQSDLGLEQWLDDHRRRTLEAYAADPLLVAEHANQEDSYRTGGYAHRQLLELVQNAADALHRSGTRGRVELRLAGNTLYCANEGEAFTQSGLEAVCHAFLSPKRGDEIGRFGLGFKSVLGVSDRPAVFSRSICFEFDGQRSRGELFAIAPAARRFPVLRLPSRVDVEREMKTDEILRDLANWAETIVRLPLVGDRTRLEREMRDFPSEFLLFVPSVSSLRLTIDGGSASPLEIEHRCVEMSPGVLRLAAQGGQQSDWRVWHRTHRPSPEALAEVSEAVRREEVRVSYAAPLSELQQLGRFWAYFPLADVTSTRGILNAPWRVNDDRTNLLDGTFNGELLEVVAEMVVAGLPGLTTPDDPARHFDYLPARGREAPNHADRYLTDRIPRLAAQTRCVPDAEGDLQLPGSLSFPHFDLRLELATHQIWQAAPGRPTEAPHWSCYQTATRRARLRSLVRLEETKAAPSEVGAANWLEMVVPDATDEQCESALQILATVTDDATRRDMRAARILPVTSGLRRLDETNEVFLRGDVLSSTAGLSLVRRSFLEGDGVEDLLRHLGFSDVDPAQELRRLVKKVARDWGDQEWRGFWELVDDVPVSEAQGVLEEHVAVGGRLRVRCRDGSWHDVGAVVVPGIVEPLSPALSLDTEFHEFHTGLLRMVGVAARPTVGRAALQDLAYMEYLRVVRERYLRDLPPHGRPGAAALYFHEKDAVGPLHLLRRFADTDDPASRAVWTHELLEADAPERSRLEHPNRGQFPVLDVQAPHLWAVRRYGLFATEWGPRPADKTLGRALTAYSPLLPVARWESSNKIDLIEELADVPSDIWREFLDRLPDQADPWQLGGLLAESAHCLPADERPPEVPALSGASTVMVPPQQLLLARTDEELRALAGRRLPYVAVANDDAAEVLVEQWGCQAASAHLRVEIVPETPGEPVVLLDRFRALRAFAGEILDGLELVECQGLAREVTGPDGIDREPTDLAQDGNTVYYLATLQDEDLLARLAEEFDLELSTARIASILNDAQDEQIKLRMAACRIERDHAQKLLTLVDAHILESKLPSGLLETVRRLGEDKGEYQVAELLLHVHGYDVLRELRHELEEVGLPVPTQWAGSPPAVGFVRQLGFPTEYAGARGQQLDADLTVPGSPDLNPLHPYQEQLARDIRNLITRPDRALLFLPTGAGKTRVSVQALVHAFVGDGLKGSLLWIAQSEELCEQAVQTWGTVWRQFGDRRPLRLCRLWGRNEVAGSDDEVTVVVATDAKLAVCREKDDYGWLSRPSVIVIDEAHEATEKNYTATLKWLGLDSRQTSCPLLGLTATPFKGSGAEANRRLVARFNGRMLDVLGDDPYGNLQAQGVLSRVEHRVLDGAELELDAGEAAHTLKRRQLPPAVLDRLGRNEGRTRRLLEDIESLPDDWPVLVFTASVLQAQILAALLRVRNVPAAAVSGATRIQERRRSIEAFRAGDIRVLTNCNVLTQGFDAPSVRALYIARPTFSPNAYLQMVGRGLRGPANGGKEECLIINVEDTFGQFGERLAYQEFDYLWERQGSRLR